MRLQGGSESPRQETFVPLEHCLLLMMAHAVFTATASGVISCRHSNMLMDLCSGRSIDTWVWTSTQNSSGMVPSRPAYSGEFFAHHDTRAKSSRTCSMDAVLIVRRRYICKHLSAVWVCELVPYCAPRNWRNKSMCIQVNLREKL
jgi:hypothetical protein